MVQIEPVDGSSLDMRRVVQTRETGGRAAPFCNRGVQERLPAKFGDCGGEVLGRGGWPVNHFHLFGEIYPSKHQRALLRHTPLDTELVALPSFAKPVSQELI